MSTIHDIPNGDLNGNKPKPEQANIESVINLSSFNVVTSTCSTQSNNHTHTSTTNTTTTSPTSTPSSDTNGQQAKDNVQEHLSTTSVHSVNGSKARDEVIEDLKIIGHIRSIEKINEKRRIFLNNTINEYTIDEKTERETKTSSGGKVNGAQSENIDTLHHQVFNETTRTHLSETATSPAPKAVPEPLDIHASEASDNLSPLSQKFVTPIKSPVTPPPKPPMLSRSRSFGLGDNRWSDTSLPNTPAPTPTSPVLTSQPLSPQPIVSQIEGPTITATTITTSIIPEPVKVTTVELRDPDMPAPRKTERPMSLSPEAPKQISVNHYERLIEELKCPGCASPMKAPIMLCKTGHSICEQCTRILMLCPLCKEPFTTIRSLTVEALCSKAHFRCANAPGGCTVRLQIDLLGWHEKQCIYKPMKCFMGRVWGDCQWSGREAYWKEHLEGEHGNKVFKNDTIDLIWNMGVKQKPLTGYYVFIVFDEMFNFYEVYDKERVLFTMACTSTVKEKKHNYAFEVTIIHHDNEALAITQKFPVHSEYDSDILSEGTCVSIPMTDLAKFIDDEKLLHYRVRIVEIKTPRKSRMSNHSSPKNGIHPIDFQQTQIEGVNLKAVPSDVIVTRKPGDDTVPFVDNSSNGTPLSGNRIIVSSSDADDDADNDNMKSLYNRRFSGNESGSESDPEFEAFIAKKWGTPQMHFNRKFLKNPSNDSSVIDDKHDRLQLDDKISMTSTSTSYKKRMTNTLRKSFRGFKTSQLFTKKSPEKVSDK